jgi:hypothetical protein
MRKNGGCRNMRVCICVGHESKFYKLVWVNEDSKGVYIGMYGEASGTHFSYHANGKRHWRTNDHSFSQELPDFTPIEKIVDFIQSIQSQTGVISTDALLHMGTEYEKEDPESSVAIFLNSDILGDNLMVQSYLFHRDREPDFAKFLQTEYYKDFRILACNIFALTNFPKHKVALVIFGKK